MKLRTREKIGMDPEAMTDEHTAIKLSIKWKLIGTMTGLMICLTVILAYLQISSQTRMLEDALNKRIELMKENLIEIFSFTRILISTIFSRQFFFSEIR